MIIGGGIRSGGILSGGVYGGGVSVMGGGARGFGAYLNFLTSVFRTTVPQASSRTFLETHVYTGSPKLTLQSTGYLGWNAHNKIPFSNNIANTSGWSVGNLTRVDGIAGVSGGLTASSCMQQAAGVSNYYFSSVSATIGGSATSQTITIWIKPVGGWQYVWVGWNSLGPRQCFDLVNGTVGAVSGTTTNVTIIAAGNGYWKCQYTTPSFSLTGSALVVCQVASNTTIYGAVTGDITKGIIVDGIQLNNGDTATNYVRAYATVPALDAPYYYNTSGVRQGILVEPAVTNSCLWSDDMTNAAWVSSSITAAKTATGSDGIAASATTLTATGANGTCLQTFVSASATRQYGAYIKRRTGTGNIQMTVDNGATWTTVTAPATFGLVSINQTAVTNPVVGFRIVTSGDAIDVQYNQLENAGTVTTSPIPTTTAAVARSIDTMYRVLGPEKITPAASPGTLVVKALASKLSGTQQVVDIDVNSSTERIELSYNGTTLRGDIAGLTGNPTLGTPSVGVFDTWGIAFANNDVAACGNGGTVQTDVTAPLTQQYLIMRFGKATYGGEDFTGAIARVRLWGSRISNADLQSATLGNNPSTPQLDFDYANATYTITPVNAGVTTTYTAATLLSSGKLTQTGPTTVYLRGSTGLLEAKTVATDLLIEYAADGSILGFIGDEPARTNSILQTNDLAASAWTANRSTRSVGSQAGPINGVNLTRWTETTANGAHGCYLTAGVVTTAAPWTLSMFVRKGTKKYVTILMNNVGNNAWSVFDLDNGTITQSGTASVEGGVWSAPTAKIETFSPGLYRISLTATLTVITTVVGYYASDLSTIPSLAAWAGYVGNVNDYIDVGCIQFEAGSYASSYIPTTGSTVNRAAIVSTLNLGSEFDNSRSIVASKAYAPRANMTDVSVTPAVWSLNIATAASTNYEVIYLTSTNQINYLDRVSSTDGAAGVATSLSYPATIKTAFGYSPSNVFLSLNGATQAVTGTPSAIQASYTNMQLGRSERTNVTQGSVYIQNLTIAPTVPTQDNVNTAASAI